MNKTELISAIAEKSGLTKNDARKALDAFVDTTVCELKNGNKVSLIGLGTFSVSKRNARVGKNPRNGEVINIPARNVAKFKAGKNLDL